MTVYRGNFVRRWHCFHWRFPVPVPPSYLSVGESIMDHVQSGPIQMLLLCEVAEAHHALGERHPGKGTNYCGTYQQNIRMKKMEMEGNEINNPMPMKSLLVLFSYHHKNTEKIANVFAKVLDTQIKTPQQVNPEELQEYSLIGFGSGIYGGSHHESLLDLADTLPQVSNKKAFIFSTCGVPAFAVNRELFEKNHSSLREKLQSRGYTVIGEFSCAALNTNSFLKLFGGLNKGRPDAKDFKHAEEFARNLKRRTSGKSDNP